MEEETQEKQNYTEVLKKCISIADERQAQYGEASESIKLANRILKDTFGVEITDRQFVMAIIALKLSRERNKMKDDNILDTINYFAIMANL